MQIALLERNAVSSTPVGWSEMKIGPGGLVRQLQFADDGTAVCCCDTYGAYVGKPSTMIGAGGTTKWSLAATTKGLPSGVVTYTNPVLCTFNSAPNGVWDIGIGPGNSSVLVGLFGGNVYVSTNGGGTWVAASGVTTDTSEQSNGQNYSSQYSVAIDPINPAICFIGRSQQGVWKTSTLTNGSGGTWSQISTSSLPISGLKTATCGLSIIRFDRSSSQTGGATQGIYAAIYGHGVYHSTDGGATWTLTSGGPTDVLSMDVGRDGYVYVALGTRTGWIYNGTSWSSQTVTGDSNGAISIAADPGTNGRVMATSQDGSITISLDHGATWGAYTYLSAGWLTATDVPWLHEVSTLLGGGVGFADILSTAMDPSHSNTLVAAMGIGVMQIAGYTNGSVSPVYTSVSQGIEQLVCNDLICGPGGTPIVISWDRPIINCPGFGATTFPTTYFPLGTDDSISIYIQGINGDWASDGSGTVIANGPSGSASGGPGFVYSGSSWSQFTTQPTTTYGAIVACASSTNWIVYDPANGKIWYTTNAGSTWTQGSAPTTGWNVTGAPLGSNAKIFAADRVNIGTFYGYNSAGIYRSTDDGATWTNMGAAPVTGSGYAYVMKMICAPTKAGHVFVSFNNGGNQSLWQSTDGGATWARPNTNLGLVAAFDFGKTKSGASYPSIWVAGTLSGVFGIYVSNDAGVTYTLLSDATWGQWPSGDLDRVTGLCASKDTYGWVGVGFYGSGYQQGYFPV